MAHEFLVLKLVERESVALLHVVVVVLYIDNDAFAYLQHHVLRGRVLLLVLIYRLEVLAYYGAVGYHFGTEIKDSEDMRTHESCTDA